MIMNRESISSNRRLYLKLEKRPAGLACIFLFLSNTLAAQTTSDSALYCSMGHTVIPGDRIMMRTGLLRVAIGI